MLLSEHNQGKENWVSKTQRILTENGFEIVWLCQGVGGCEMRFVAEFKDRLIWCYKQNMHSEIDSNEKYGWYYSFKNSFVSLLLYYGKKISHHFDPVPPKGMCFKEPQSMVLDRNI